VVDALFHVFRVKTKRRLIRLSARDRLESKIPRRRTDPDLDRLPAAESRACRDFWNEIDAQIERVRRQK
jgi:hypothetical protein